MLCVWSRAHFQIVPARSISTAAHLDSGVRNMVGARTCACTQDWGYSVFFQLWNEQFDAVAGRVVMVLLQTICLTYQTVVLALPGPLGDAGVAAVAKALANSRLTGLDLDNNGFLACGSKQHQGIFVEVWGELLFDIPQANCP